MKLQSNINTNKGHILRVDRGKSLYALHNFNSLSKNLNGAYGALNTTDANWWVQPSFMKRMHYERTSSLTYTWWSLWKSGSQ